MSSQRSRKRAADAYYRTQRELRFIRARGRCERCLRPAEQTHHVVRRRLGGGSVNHDVENLRALCAMCHAWVHREVRQAREQGWIRSEWPQLGSTPSMDAP